MKNISALIILVILIFPKALFSQGVGINISGNAPHSAAGLDVDFSDKGFLPPRMTTTQRDQIVPPLPVGLTIFNTTSNCLEIYFGSSWQTAGCGCTSAPSAPSAAVHSAYPSQINWNWSAVSGASGYKYNTSNDFSTATDLHTTNSYTQMGLTCGQLPHTLYVWAYNACGASGVLTLTANTADCPYLCGSMLSDIDNNTYSSVAIGTQCWMKENLKVTKNPNGTPLTRYCYNNDGNNCTVYGGLYDWTTILNGAAQSSSNPSNVQGICPNGWHLPSDDEWCELDNFIEANIDCSVWDWRGVNAGGRMKATTIWNSPNSGATNSSGFTALPGGFMSDVGVSSGLGNSAAWWSSTGYFTTHGWQHYVYYQNSQVGRYPNGIAYKQSVRCLRD